MHPGRRQVTKVYNSKNFCRIVLHNYKNPKMNNTTVEQWIFGKCFRCKKRNHCDFVKRKQ